MSNEYHHPDSPEAVALELMRMIREAEAKDGQAQRGRNVSPRADLLGLYAECLARVSAAGTPGPSSSYLN